MKNHNQSNGANSENQVADAAIKIGGFILSGTAAVAVGVLQGIGSALDSMTDL